MNDLDTRLTKCFITAFPDLRESQIQSATADSTPSWDSMGVHTLLALVEEEFGVTFNQRDAATLKSYSVVRDAVSTAVTK